MELHISTYEDALSYMSPLERLNDTWETLQNTQPGTPEYTALVKIRLQAKREFFSNKVHLTTDSNKTARAELYREERA